MNPQTTLAKARREALDAGVSEDRLLKLDRRATEITRDCGGTIPKAEMLKLNIAELEYLAVAIVALRDE